MNTDRMLNVAELTQLAMASKLVKRTCACAADSIPGWTRISADFPEQQMRVVGTLAGDPYVEATYAEYDPARVGYWSEHAPIAVRHFPYNRCDVLQCIECGRAYLTYVEAGGYYVEPRIRALDPGLIVDAAIDN